MRIPVFLLLASLAIPALPAQTIQINKENRTVAVTTTDEAEATADLASLTVGFETFGADQHQTYADATRVTNSINDALKAAGIPAASIESREQNLSAIGEENRLRFAKGIRFRFTQSWLVTVPAASAAEALHVVILAGSQPKRQCRLEA